MTQYVHPSPNRDFEATLTAGAIRYGALSDGWIVPTTETRLANLKGMTGTPLNAFAYTTSGLTVTVDTGEAFVGGSWVAKDTTTSVTLAASTANQTVYLGWDRTSANAVLIGLDAAFTADDPRIPLGTFTTDTTTVTASTSDRTAYLGPTYNFQNTTYDADQTGVVDDAEALGGVAPANWMRKDIGQTMTALLTLNSGLNVTGTTTLNSGATLQGDVNMNKNQLLGARIENRTDRPAAPAVGQIIYRTDKDV